jgi:hypothetical protein
MEKIGMRKIRLILPCLFMILLSASFSSAQDVTRFDRFSNLNCEVEVARLDNFAVQLQSNPGAVGYVVVYGGNFRRRGEAQARVSRIKEYLIKSRGLESNRVKTIEGGYMDELTVDLWIVPPDWGAPSLEPTIPPEAVKFKKGRIKRSEYQRCSP